MANYYIDEDLTTGNADGTDAANAYQTWALAMGGISQLTEDSVIYFYSTGVIDVSRGLTLDLNNFDLEIIFMGGAIALSTTEYVGCLIVTNSDTVSTVTIQNPTFKTSANGYGLQSISQTTVNANNIRFIGTSAKRAVYGASSATITIDGMVATGVEYAIGNVSTGIINAYNCYGNATVQAFFDSGSGTLNLFTCASNDTSSSTGLQSIAYDTSNFTNITSGSEDFTLPEGSALIAVGTTTTSEGDIDGVAWGDPRDIGIKAYTIVAETIIFTYTEINDGFSGYFNFVDDPTLRKFGKNASWFGKVKGSSASLKCGSTGTIPYSIFVDGTLYQPTLSSGEIELFSGLTDEEHDVVIIAYTTYATTGNYIDTTETEVLSVTGSSPYIQNIPFEYVSDPDFAGKSSYSTADTGESSLTPAYDEVTPWDYEFGQIVFRAKCDTIYVYTDNTSVVYTIDSGDFTETTFTEVNSDGASTVRRAVLVSDSLDGTDHHVYRFWGGTGETYGIQGVVCLLDGEIVSVTTSGGMRTVLMLGASVIAGSEGDNEGYADTWHIGNDLNYLMTKAGSAGNPTTTTEIDLPSIITANGIPDVAVFGSSTNDSGSTTLQADYESLITAILAEGVSQVVCRGVVPYISGLHTALEAAVTAIGLDSVTFISSEDWTFDTIDGTHPSVIGYEELAAQEEPELETDITIYYQLAGVTYDNSGAVLTDCQVSLFRHYGSGEYEYITTQVSDAITGAFDFTAITDNEAYYCIMYHKDGTPNVFDVSDNVLEPSDV